MCCSPPLSFYCNLLTLLCQRGSFSLAARLLSSIREFSPHIKLQLFLVLSTIKREKSAYNPQCLPPRRVHIQSVQV